MIIHKNKEIRLKNLTIEYFRGFYEPQLIEFAIPTMKSGSGLTIIVGPNNSGKSTILEALKKFTKRDKPQLTENERHINGSSKLKLVNTKHEEKIIETYGGSNTVYEGEKIYPTQNDFYLINARRYWRQFFSPDSIDEDDYKSRISSRVSGEFIDDDSDFGPLISNIEKDANKKQKFDTLMKNLLPNFHSWTIELNEDNRNYIKYTTGIGDTHISKYWGDGTINLFKIIAPLVEENSKEIIVIDEPELSLHPQLQKRLVKLLSEYSKNKQIILMTHSPYFVRWEDFENGAKIIRLNKKRRLQLLAVARVNTIFTR